MKLGIHVPFYFVESRLQYFNEVIDSLLSLPAETKIYIYTNCDLRRKIDLDSSVEIRVLNYRKYGKAKLSGFFDTPILKRFAHPYYLTWDNRKVVEQNLNNFDAQIYLEDDIRFDSRAFAYWLKYLPVCKKHGYNLGFLRTEKDSNGDFYCTDLVIKPSKIVELDGLKFLLNDVNTYCAFWIYESDTLSKFIESEIWDFKFKGFQIREKSAIGWHGLDMAGFKGTLIPLIQISEEEYQVAEDCFVHHLPNNYIDHDFLCAISFPFIVKEPLLAV